MSAITTGASVRRGKAVWRVVASGEWEGEDAVVVCRADRYTQWRKRLRRDPAAAPPRTIETVPIANLVRYKGGWRECWRQLDLMSAGARERGEQ